MFQLCTTTSLPPAPHLEEKLSSLSDRVIHLVQENLHLVESDTPGLPWRVDHLVARWRLVERMARARLAGGHPELQDVQAGNISSLPSLPPPELELEAVALLRWLEEVEESLGPVRIRVARGWGVEERRARLRRFQGGWTGGL